MRIMCNLLDINNMHLNIINNLLSMLYKQFQMYIWHNYFHMLHKSVKWLMNQLSLVLNNYKKKYLIKIYTIHLRMFNIYQMMYNLYKPWCMFDMNLLPMLVPNNILDCMLRKLLRRSNLSNFIKCIMNKMRVDSRNKISHYWMMSELSLCSNNILTNS